MSKGPEYPHEDALAICNRLMRFLVGDEDIDDIDRLYIVGSLRRGKPKVRDIDLLCIGNRDIIEARIEARGYEIESSGEKRIIARDMGETGGHGEYPFLPDLNIFFTNRDSWGAALMHTTGPSRYNIRKRYLVKNYIIGRKGWKLNEYGLYDKSGLMIAGESEEGIYDALNWEWCAPRDRE